MGIYVVVWFEIPKAFLKYVNDGGSGRRYLPEKIIQEINILFGVDMNGERILYARIHKYARVYCK